jgi:hypothetical protein
MRYLARYPAVNVDLASESRLVDIVLHGFDAGIRLTGSVPAAMVAVPLGLSLAFSAVGAPGHLARSPMSVMPHDLMSRRCTERVARRRDLSMGVRARRRTSRGRVVKQTAMRETPAA